MEEEEEGRGSCCGDSPASFAGTVFAFQAFLTGNQYIQGQRRYRTRV